MSGALDRLLRVENIWVLALVLVAVLVGVEARWRGDARWGGVARAIRISTRVGLGLLVAAIALFFFVLIVIGPIGGP